MKTKNLKIWQVALFLFATMLLVNSCEKETNDEPKKKNPEIFQHDIRDYSKWYYYSFKTKQFVGIGEADPKKGDDSKWAERLDWDIAFHRQDIRTNSGTSGKGKGGILELKTENYFSVKDFDLAVFEQDKVVDNTIMIEFTMPPTYLTSSVNSIASKWVKIADDMSHWELKKKNVFIVKTTEGKFVKIQFVNFLNDVNKSGYLTMRYAYLNK